MYKIIPYKDLDSRLNELKSSKLVVVGGCFDVLHEGHIKFIKQAKKQGSTLLIILENDESIARRKGKGRPINRLKDRANSLTQLTEVDFVLLIPNFKKDEDYYKLTKKLQPDIIAITEDDPLKNKKIKQAEMVGGKVVSVIKRLPNLSTTNLIKEK